MGIRHARAGHDGSCSTDPVSNQSCEDYPGGGDETPFVMMKQGEMEGEVSATGPPAWTGGSLC